MNKLNVKNNLSIDLDTLAILLDEQEVGSITCSNDNEKAVLDIFIEEPYRFHHYAIDSLKAYIEYIFKNNLAKYIEFYIDKDNRAGLNMMGYIHRNYIAFDEESNEHIYLTNKELYYTRIEKKEVFDSFDENGVNLNQDFIRGKKYSNVYHKIVSIIVVNEKKQILVTLRNPVKAYPLCYEITTGSVLKGETEEEGAIRELQEETGIHLIKEALCPLGYIKIKDCFNYGYIVFVNMAHQTIELQEEEVVDYTFLSFNEFASIIEHQDFSPTNRNFIHKMQSNINEILNRHFKKIY